MNYLLDSNILLYAKMDAMPEHAVISQWLEKAVSDQNNTVNVCETSVLSFLRIASNPKVFDPALPPSQASEFLRHFLASPNVNLLRTMPSHYPDVVKLMETHGFRGNMVMDVHLAVLALGIGAILVTRDKDFAKIAYLKTLDPLKKSRYREPVKMVRQG